ncbi:hypothetical protein GCM10009745_44940 [Kribbella yunnanensis]|uniref:PQQ-binding-like beta-propeller repeat protein n=1 Tax=Kribbella yunnanensis TaxID=190194 RepID=A0ABP4TVK1_9ACTN
MTGLLKDTFTEEAEAIGDPNIDLAAIAANGTRRIKRRRLATVITAVAATAAIVGGGLTVVQQVNGDPDSKVAAGGPLAERRATWADGKEIHYGSEVIRVPVAISSFLQTNAAFVFTSADGGVYQVRPGEAAVKIGKGSTNHRLATDADQAVVGWVDTTPAVPQFVLYDVAAERELARTATGNKAGPPTADRALRVAAIDNGIAYFGASDGLRRWTIATGVGELIKPKASPEFLLAAEAGQLVWEHPNGGDNDNDLGMGPDVNATDPAHYRGWHGSLSPQARYLLTDKADVVGLVDTRGGVEWKVDIPGYPLIVPTQWKNDSTFYAIGFPSETARLDLLSCSIKSVDVGCTAVLNAFAPPVTETSTTQFPNGVPVN